MKKGFLFLIMLLLAGCGGGGSSAPNSATLPAGSGTGAISLQFVDADKSTLQKAVALNETAPGRVRIVLTSSSLKFRKVVDLAFGTALDSINVPVAADYKVEAIFYSKGTPNELSNYGVTTNKVNVTSDGNTKAEVRMTKIEVTLAPLTEVFSGATYAVPEPAEAVLAAFGLQSQWSLSKSTSPFTGRVHFGELPSTSHTGLAVPVVGQPGSLYFQGEFFMKEDLLDEGESAYEWSFVTEPATPTALKLASVVFTSEGLPPDIKDPEVRSFAVPAGKLATTEISPLSIAAVDNAGIAAYLITESASIPGPDDTGWSATAPTSYTYNGDVVHGSDNMITLHAWAKDHSGRISSAVAGVTDKTVILNCSPVVTSFTVPRTTQFTTSNIPITIAGVSHSHGDLKYLVTETADKPASDAAWQDKPLLADNYSTNYNVTSITPSPGATYTVNLYAWVKDNTSISEYARNAVTISDIPLVTDFSVEPVAAGNEVSIKSFAAQAAPGKSIAGYLVTSSSFKPAAAAFLPTPQTTLSYPGLASGVPTSRFVFAWVIDDAGRISLSKAATVRFSGVY